MTDRSYSTRLRGRRRRGALFGAAVFIGLFVLIGAAVTDREEDTLSSAAQPRCDVPASPPARGQARAGGLLQDFGGDAAGAPLRACGPDLPSGCVNRAGWVECEG